jgi:uncharacterized surface protein with fasciclin (FAS1) repeats
MHIQRMNKFLILLTGIWLSGCIDISKQEKYQRPEWLEGKLYTQISSLDNVKYFTTCLELTGFDTIIDNSGSFTVFVPTDEAFELFLSENPVYGNDVRQIPLSELNMIVKSHIIQDAWSKTQLQSLDDDGWIDRDDPDNDEPRAYKRQTILKDANHKYWVQVKKGNYSIVDSTETNIYRKVYTGSRKYIPIFFQEYFSIYDLISTDYEFYYQRPFEGNGLYYSNSKIIQDEIFAENGFVYIIDKVVLPLLNGEQLLEKEYPEETYKSFLELVYLFPDFSMNLEETYNQVEAKEGKKFDTLYNLTFPGLVFNIHEELSGPNINVPNYTVRYQNGLFVPTDEAFQNFLDEVVTVNSGYPHWQNFDAVPIDIKKIIVNTHMSNIPVYQSDIINGFENGEGDIIMIDELNILRKYYGTNCTFIGLNKAITPRAFSSITGPVYLRPGYAIFMYAMQYSKILPAITKQQAEYVFYPIPDNILLVDSSLLMVWDDVDLNRYHFQTFNRGIQTMNWWVDRNDLAKRILNQVGTSIPEGIARKEFIENLAGNFIIANNDEYTLSGAVPNVFGYMGDSLITIHPVLFEELSDNGKSYSVNGWFQNSNSSMLGVLSGYPKFMDLIKKAGLYDEKLYEFKFLSEGEFYTVFIPSETAINESGANNLPIEELQKLIKYHFVRGELIFTDGKKPWKEYETLRLDESSTEFSNYYSTLNIRPDYDVIEILDSTGNPYVLIPEKEGHTNIFITTDTNPESESNEDFVTTGVVHEIDKVLIKQ